LRLHKVEKNISIDIFVSHLVEGLQECENKDYKINIMGSLLPRTPKFRDILTKDSEDTTFFVLEIQNENLSWCINADKNETSEIPKKCPICH